MPPDYSGQNLCGRSFRGENLEKADFSYADLRSTDFTNAILRGANFSHAKAGLQKRWAIFLVCFSWLLSGFLEFFLAFLSVVMKGYKANSSNPVNSYIFGSIDDRYIPIFGWAAFIFLISVFIFLFILRPKLDPDSSMFSGFLIIGGLLVIGEAAFPKAISTVITAFTAFADANPPSPFVLASSFSFFAAVIVVVAAIPGAIAVITAFNIPFAIAIVIVVAGTFPIAIAFSFAFSFFAPILKAFAFAVSFTGVIPGFIVGTVLGVLGGAVISWETMNENEDFSLITNFGFAYAAFGGTSFRKADLTDTDFTKATLESTDFRNATLIRTCFRETKKLDRVCFGSTYFQEAKVRQVLVEGTAQDKNFDSQTLRGVNFKDANLVNSSFIDADLSDANLQNADLSGANLKYAILNGVNFSDANLSEAVLEGAKLDNAILGRINFSRANLRSLNLNDLNLSNANLSGTNLSRIQALGTNFTQAIFTGACIENWNTNSITNLADVICDYIYLREGQQERRPSDLNKNFAIGEFTKLFQKAQETVDLIFRDGINWQAFLASFEKLQVECSDDELSIQAIENKNDGAFVIRVNVPFNANKAEIEKYLKREYELALAAIEEKYRSQLQAKDEQIAIYREKSADIMEMARLTANRPIQNIIDVTANTESKFMTESYHSKYDQRNSNNQFVDTAQLGSNPTFNQHNYTLEQKQNLAEAAAEIQQLLYQLSQTNPTTTESVTEAIHQEIKRNPTLKARLQSALKAGGLEALKAIFNHPLFSIPVETVKGWLEAE